jgi:hypothetical protein
MPPLRRGAAQLRLKRNLAGGHLRWRVRGVPGDPDELGFWVHLFRTKLHTLSTPELRVRCAVRGGGMSISLREPRREFYIPCTMTSNNAEWGQGWFYLRNDEPGLPPTPARF